MGIRLVCSDLDGTLLQYGKKELEGEIFDQIRALHDRGILFCPASGRQYTSLRKLFAPVADCCIFLCENGGVIYKDELCIAKNPMPRALAEEIAEDLWSRSDGQGEVMLSGQNTAYLMERGLGMLDRIKFIGNNYQVIQDPSEIPEDIVKVSVYLHEGVAAYADRFVPRWEQANCAVAGPYWIDTTLANKGIGVQSICKILDFDLADVMAFGDNYNDVSMLDIVGHPYIMDGYAILVREEFSCLEFIMNRDTINWILKKTEYRRSNMEHLPKKIHQNGISYTLVGDYYIPDLKLPEESRPIGRWGRMHKAFLQEHRPGQYNALLLSGKLWTYLADLNEQAADRLACIVSQMQKAEAVTEELKARDQLAWVEAMNSIRSRAEEIILSEMIFV